MKSRPTAPTIAGESLHGGSERSFHEAVKVKPGLCGRPHDDGDARAM